MTVSQRIDSLHETLVGIMLWVLSLINLNLTLRAS